MNVGDAPEFSRWGSSLDRLGYAVWRAQARGGLAFALCHKVLDSMNGAGYRFPMATPPRPSAHDTPAIHERALEDLSFIRRTMEGASSFTDVPGLGLVLIGVSALGTAPLAAAQPNAARWMGVWIADAVVAVLVGGGLMWRKMRQRARTGDAPVLSTPARKFLFGFWPAILAGAVLTFALVDREAVWRAHSVVPRALPGMWLLLYGLGVSTAGAYSVGAVPIMGAGLMALGTVALLAPALSPHVLLAAGFGVWQIAFGLWIARRHGG